MQSSVFKGSLYLLLICASFCQSVVARDISNEQRAASQARDRYNNAVANDKNLALQIAEQEKRVANEQARLNELRNKQTESKALLESTQLELDEKVKTLENAWGERNKN